MAGIYIHIPYCKSKCIYCDFYSTPVVETMEQYVHSLLCEAKLRREEIVNSSPSKIEGAGGSMPSQSNDRSIIPQFTTLYLGGGTPSVMPVELLSALINGLSEIFDLSLVEEFTIEVNPDDVTREYVEELRQLGVNRVSMGVQSFNDGDLLTINRRHSAQQAIDAVDAIKEAGISNVSIDLIYGLPGQTLDSWQHNVEQAIGLNVQHISAYNLGYEPRTRLWVMREQGKVQEVSDDDCIAMHDILVIMLKEAGFEHYEISNFARPGYRSRHNSSYWNFTPYLGLGAAAHSFDGNVRRYNPSSIKEYLEKLSNGLPAFIEENLEWWERYDEEVMVRLRMSDGLDTKLIAQRYGDKVSNHLIKQSQQFIGQGLLRVKGNSLILTPSGVMMSDNIIRNLMWG
ncbi:MAG: radical SAM family heme chaperone HemW [Muribaculaceae bacterium]|nr:radical SAM family heme chaperone HemW [Muribaculaceae bacterium]